MSEEHPFRSIQIDSLRVTWRERWTRWLSFVTVAVVVALACVLGWRSGAIAEREQFDEAMALEKQQSDRAVAREKQQCAKERAEETCFRHATIAADVAFSTTNDSTYIHCKDAAPSSNGGSIILNGHVTFENSSINSQ